ncbi:hypothetical protein Tco_0068903, partial [Tanacetum coccineum]
IIPSGGVTCLVAKATKDEAVLWHRRLGLWYPKDSPFHLEAFLDSDYAGNNHDRRSTSGGCQYLGRRLVSWQCKKQTIVVISFTEAEYVAATSCCGQVKSQKLKKRGKKQKKKVSSVKLGRNKDECNLSEEHHDQDDEGFDATEAAVDDEGFDATEAVVTPDFERKSDETEALERKSDETKQVAIEEEKDASDVKSRDTEELDLEEI